MMEKRPEKRDLLDFGLNADEVRRLFDDTTRLKAARRNGGIEPYLKGKTLGMLFEKSSTRTRVSFETGIYLLGGKGLFLSSKDIQLGRGEPIADSARVFSRYLDGLMIRTFAQKNVETLAANASIPVINGLSDDFHPCQVLADLYTFQEQRGPANGRRIAWIGDGNNMANTWIQAAARVGFHLTLAVPVNYDPHPEVLRIARKEIEVSGNTDASITVVRDPMEAARNADLVTTDVWASMGQEEEMERRRRAFEGYCVSKRIMDQAASDALFMHCLPAHRGEEVTAEVIDGPQSVVWDEAENRLHVQNAIMVWLMSDRQPQ